MRTFARLYGSMALTLAVPTGAGASPARRSERADASGAVSRGSRPASIEEVRGDPATMWFQAYSDLSAFFEPPVSPCSPSIPPSLFVGTLEPYKNVDGLAAGLASRRGDGRTPNSRWWGRARGGR